MLSFDERYLVGTKFAADKAADKAGEPYLVWDQSFTLAPIGTGMKPQINESRVRQKMLGTDCAGENYIFRRSRADALTNGIG